jgi:ABC-type uncharacterized transport system involved in gliding motility auxiliary subunit
VAVAVEKGTVSDLALQIKPTRLVVFGDSAFVSNGALNSRIGANAGLFMSALNWLVARETLLAIGPKTQGELRLDMTAARLRTLYVCVAVLLPLAIALVGLAVWNRRRY